MIVDNRNFDEESMEDKKDQKYYGNILAKKLKNVEGLFWLYNLFKP